MTAQGDADQVGEGRKTIVDATIGIILIVAAYSITNFIFTDVVGPIAGTGAPAGTAGANGGNGGAGAGAGGIDIGNGAGLGGPNDIQLLSYCCKYTDEFGDAAGQDLFAKDSDDAFNQCDKILTSGKYVGGAVAGQCTASSAKITKFCCQNQQTGAIKTVDATTSDAAAAACETALPDFTTATAGACSAQGKKYCCVDANEKPVSGGEITATSDVEASTLCGKVAGSAGPNPGACPKQSSAPSETASCCSYDNNGAAVIDTLTPSECNKKPASQSYPNQCADMIICQDNGACTPQAKTEACGGLTVTKVDTEKMNLCLKTL